MPRQCSRDLDASRNPYPVVGRDVVEESLQRSGARRAPDDAAVQADRQHLRLSRNALGVEHVECVAQVREELVTVGESRGRSEPHVVGVQRVRHDEVVPIAYPHPVGQVVGVGVGVVDETAVLDDQVAGVRRVAAGVPAERRGAGELGEDRRPLRPCARARCPRRSTGRTSTAARGRRSRGRVRRKAATASGLRCIARATAKIVSGSPRSSKIRSTRHNPAREPYS